VCVSGVGALISFCIYSYRIVMLLMPYMWASLTFLPLEPSLSMLLTSRGGSMNKIGVRSDNLKDGAS